MRALFSSYIFWLGLLFVPLCALLFDLTWKVGINTFWPRLSEAVRQMEIAGEDDVMTYILRQRNKYARDQVLAELGGAAGIRARGPAGSDSSNNSSGGSNNSTTQVLRGGVGGGAGGGVGGGAGVGCGFLRQRPKTPPETTSLLGMQPVYYRSGGGTAASAPILLTYMPNNTNTPNASDVVGAGNYNAAVNIDNLHFDDAVNLSINNNNVPVGAKPVTVPPGGAAATQRFREILRDESFRSRGSLPAFASTSQDSHMTAEPVAHENLEVYKRGYAFSQDESNTVAQSQYVSMYDSTDNLHHHVQQQQQQRFSRNSQNKSMDGGSSSRGGSLLSSQRQTPTPSPLPPPPSYAHAYSTPTRAISSQPSLTRLGGGSRNNSKGIVLLEQQSLPHLLASSAAVAPLPPPPARLSSQILLANGAGGVPSSSVDSNIGTPPLQHRAA